ncbi:hypothetical protein K3U94_14130 [Mycolicibacter heraklionensis]|uniref:Uncharacterized protein n=1 Tax=Mycolicibacter heraklionensis TaxID=512402 RepID=A0A9X7WEU1_9MYCO|nr:hypothetical protein [Mycolicibacter heraklionensis]QZA06189.1 hypothetical protein K3U94_14130 [Mycolicibacter heraklionensis]
MSDKALGDGTIDDLPWASIFDPAANARALNAIQAEGFRAARRIIDEFAQAVAAPRDGAAAADPTGPPDLERFTRAWWSTAGQFLLRSSPARPQGDAGTVTLDVNDPASKDAVRLEVTGPGSATGEVWLHNRGTDDRAAVRLRCSELLGHGGQVIGAGAVRLDPAAVPMPRRSSRGVQITVDVGPQVCPGTYRGTLLAVGYPDLWLPVVLTVAARES